MPSSDTSNAVETRMESTLQQDAILADICALTGMPFPNLFYRVLAEEPSRLAHCWKSVRPGLVRVGAGTLRERLMTRTTHATGCAGLLKDLTAEHRRTLTEVLGTYDSGNSCNAVLVHLMLHGSAGDSISPLVVEAPSDPSVVPPPLPPMLELDAMTEPARRQIRRLAQLADPEGDVIPSLFRHFGHDEELLAYVTAALERAFENGALDQLQKRILQAVANAVAQWPNVVQPVTDPAIRSVLEPFARTIPRMLAVSAILRPAS